MTTSLLSFLKGFRRSYTLAVVVRGGKSLIKAIANLLSKQLKIYNHSKPVDDSSNLAYAEPIWEHAVGTFNDIEEGRKTYREADDAMKLDEWKSVEGKLNQEDDTDFFGKHDYSRDLGIRNWLITLEPENDCGLRYGNIQEAKASVGDA